MEDQEPTAETKQPKRSRLRFSLGTMLVSTVVLALIISNFITTSHLQESREVIKVQQTEIDAYRKELRLLDLQDKSKVHIYEMETYQGFTWRWRVFTPPKEKFRLRTAAGMILEDTFPQDADFTYVGPGEIILTCRVGKNSSNHWEIVTRQDGEHSESSHHNILSDEDMKWYGQGGTSYSSKVPATNQQATLGGEDKIELLRLNRYTYAAPESGYGLVNKRLGGILFWLEQVKESEN